MSKVEFLGGDKVKLADSEHPIQNVMTAINANDLRDGNNDNNDRIVAIETGQGNEITQVSAEWDSGFTFDVMADNFPVNDIYYPATPADVILDGSEPALDRIDRIVAIAPIAPATIGTVGFIKGTPASTALVVPPDYDPSLVFVIKNVIIRAAASEPEDVLNTLIFNEDTGEPTEWIWSSNSANITVTTNDPHKDTKSIESTNQIAGDYSQFDTTTPIDTSTIDSIDYWTKLKASLDNSWVYVKFFLGNTQVGSVYKFKSGQNGLDGSSLVYQKIIIDGSKLKLPSGTIDNFRIYPYKSFSGFFMDDVFIRKGSGSDPVPVGGIEEAPIDGNQYGREDGQWTQIVAGAGDMLLAAVQTVTGAKTFENAKLLLRNVADTFNGIFTNTNTADRTYTLPDKNGTVAMLDDVDGDVVGPGSAVDENIAVFDSTTGKIIKDGLINKSAITANTAKVTNATHTGEVTGSVALAIASNVVDRDNLADDLKKVLTNATVITTQSLDWDAYSGFIFTMTGATTFSDSNLPATPNEDQITILMTGDFAATLPTYWKVGGDTYDGTGWNLLAVECKDDTGAAEQVVCIISNLT